MISPPSSLMAAAMSSRTPGGSSIAASARPTSDLLCETEERIPFRGPSASRALFRDRRSFGEAERRTMRVAILSISGMRPRCSRASSRSM